MVAVLVIVATIFGQPAIRYKIVPPAVCDMIGHREAERDAQLPGVDTVTWRCISTPGPSDEKGA
ncbi:hypothetical protein [Bosea sp. MMO-172]|uniref:hypothetical protein n=1 Tax=Bosea sp. MMO-172 TaxID=3127885 RepID=UPI003019907D